MNYLYIGKIVNTHGIKGEIRIISSFEEKELVFCKNTKIYIGDNFEEKVIISYRHHKKYEMIIGLVVFGIGVLSLLIAIMSKTKKVK